MNPIGSIDDELIPAEAALMAHVVSAHQRLNSWPEVAKILNGNAAEAHRIAQGIFPKSAKRRKELGLPAMGRAKLCTECGKVHQQVKKCGTSRGRRNKNISAMSKKELLYCLENRTDVRLRLPR